MNIGELLKKRRKELGMSADFLAEQLNVSRSTIFRYENGHIEKMPVTIINKLSELLKVSPAYLMGWDVNVVVPDITPIYSKLNKDNRNKIYSIAIELLNEQETNNKYSDNILYPYFKNYEDSIAYIEENDKSAALSGRTVSDMSEEETVRYANNLKDFIDKIRSEK